VNAENSAVIIHSDTKPAVARPSVSGLLQSGLAAPHSWFAQFVPTAACVAAEKDTKVAPPHTITKNKMMKCFTMCLPIAALGGSTIGLSATGA
jgi:hypothetical protein